MRNIYRNLFGWMAAAAALLAASCTQDETLDPNASGDEFTVTFAVKPQEAMGGTRADGLPHISDGSKADMLIYAVYADNGDKTYTLLTEYGLGADEALQAKGVTVGPGQTAVSVKSFPTTNEVAIRLHRNQSYRVAFWAQNSNCRAYNTTDLQKVEAIYGADTDGDNQAVGTPNNDELRDVFCNYDDVTENSAGQKDVTLYRPLAQVNVGTSGYDFESATRGTKSKKYRYSKIQISSAARYLSVVDNKVLTTTTGSDSDSSGLSPEVRQTVTYDFAPLPAYYNYQGEGGCPADPSKLTENEEFLRVDLDKSGKIAPYVSFADYKAADEKTEGSLQPQDVYTETFKYLSMCYILVPVQENNAGGTDIPDNANPSNPGGSATGYTTTLDNVTVWLAETDDPDQDEQLEIIKLTNVPVHRNWRTNIVSQSLLTNQIEMSIDLEPMYAGDYNIGDDFTLFNGPLAEGVYYDAINDEILISNADGLEWLAKMVNGKYSYPVWIEDPLTGKVEATTFADKGIEEPQDARLRARIMRATHQEWNSNTEGTPEAGGAKWPDNNNFHFMYADMKRPNGDDLPSTSREPNQIYPAKVRLTADIDLSGREWIPIGFANNTAETYDIFDESKANRVAFCGTFDGGGHTITGLRNKRFAANVHDDAQQQNDFTNLDGNRVTDGSKGPYDQAVQWFGVGFFGQIGQSGSVSNLRLFNVDLLGYCHVGGIAGIVTGPDAYIRDCYVDGGSIIAMPMYRGDSHRAGDPNRKGRTFARGIYAGGIAGYLNIGRRGSAERVWTAEDPYGAVTNCQVRNVMLRAYRQIGGIAGAINIYDRTNWTPNDVANAGTSRCVRYIKGCDVSNVTIIADKFQPYDVFFHQKDGAVYKNGFGWQSKQIALSDIFVGGELTTGGSSSFLDSGFNLAANNTSSNVTITEFATGIQNDTDPARQAEIYEIPLNLMPMLSSWFCDEVTLMANYSGNHSTRRHYKLNGFYRDSRDQSGTAVQVPFKLPYDLNVDWDNENLNGNVGMYIESISLDGTGNGRDRTIVTIEDATGANDCVAYIGGRDRMPFQDLDANWNNQQTIVRSVVFRGNPYAYTGICLAPTSCTSRIELDKISVYDVYQTLTLDQTAGVPVTIDPSNATLAVTNSNFRGYTCYGAGWKAVSFEKTVFERGASIPNLSSSETNNVQTCKIESNTTFTGCYFKAPYTIEIAEGVTVTFDTECKATGTSSNDKELPATVTGSAGGSTIEITVDANGDPQVQQQ